MNKKEFDGKVALITGSSRGIGLATAEHLCERGAKVMLNARGAERLEKARARLAERGYEVAAIAADVSDADECRALVERTVEEFGRLDILVNNAGVSMRAALDELDAATCKEIVDVNLLGCIYPSLFAVQQLKANRGSLVFISSIAGLIGLPTASLYCATKTALRGFADSLRCELAPVGVHVGVVYVGFTENDPEKTVAGAGGTRISPDRPAHMTQAETGRRIVELISKRKRHIVLSTAGKFAELASRLSPELVENTVILSRKLNIAEMFGMK